MILRRSYVVLVLARSGVVVLHMYTLRTGFSLKFQIVMPCPPLAGGLCLLRENNFRRLSRNSPQDHPRATGGKLADFPSTVVGGRRRQ